MFFVYLSLITLYLVLVCLPLKLPSFRREILLLKGFLTNIQNVSLARCCVQAKKLKTIDILNDPYFDCSISFLRSRVNRMPTLDVKHLPLLYSFKFELFVSHYNYLTELK